MNALVHDDPRDDERENADRMPMSEDIDADVAGRYHHSAKRL
jgi:hypothetical protein